MIEYLKKEEIIKNLSRNLKRLREAKKMTQEDLIYDLGEELISLRSYKTYESGRKKTLPSIESLTILAKYYGCTLDYLIYGVENIYDQSFTKRDSLKRICALIHSLALRPVKEENPDSSYYGQYLFLSFDQEVHLLIDKMEAQAREKNIRFYETGECEFDSSECDYSLVEEIDNLNDDWGLSAERYKYLLRKSGIDPDEFYIQCMRKIERVKKTTLRKKKVKAK